MKIAERLKSRAPETAAGSGAPPSNIMTEGQFLYNGGYYNRLLELALSQLQKKEKAPWPFIMKTVMDHKIRVPEKAVKALIKSFLLKNEKEFLPYLAGGGNWKEFSRDLENFIQSKKTSAQKEKTQKRTQPADQIGLSALLERKEDETGQLNLSDLQLKRAKRRSPEEKQLLRRLEFAKAKGLPEEEERIIKSLLMRDPNNPEYKKLNQDLKTRQALKILEKQNQTQTERESLPSSTSKKELSVKSKICEEVLKLAEGNPKSAKNLAVFLYTLGWPEESLKILEKTSRHLSECWLYLDWLMETHQFALALDTANRLLSQIQPDSSSLFPVIYIKARALYALGEKEKALSYMSDIAAIRPKYKNSSHLLEKWRKP